MPVPCAGAILDSLPPDVRAVTDADVAKVQDEARALVRGQALARARGTSLAARSVSDFVRVNRVEGLAAGAGLARGLGEGFSASVRGRYGFADERAKGAATIEYRRASGAALSLSAYDDHRQAGDVRETSQVISSLAAQEFGTDFTDPYRARGLSLLLRSRPLTGSWALSVEGVSEKQRPLAVNASPANGEYEPVIAADSLTGQSVTLSADRPTRLGPLGFEMQLHAEASFIRYRAMRDDARTMSRFVFRGSLERPVAKGRLVSRTLAAWIAGDDEVPAQNLIFLGGPTTGPGYGFHQFSARSGLSQRIEVQVPVPFKSFGLGRYGRTPASITIAPYANAVWVDGVRESRVPRSSLALLRGDRSGWHPSFGIGVLSVFELLRLDVARGTRDGRWSFSVDVSREFWPIL
jgi:hypothetical protein